MSKQPPSHLPFISPSLPWCLTHDTSRRISHQSERFWWHRLLGFVRWEFLCGSDSFFFNTVILRACGGEKKRKVHVSSSLHLSTPVSDDCTHDTDALLWKMSVSDPLCFCGPYMSPSLSVCRVVSDTRSVSPFSQTHTCRGNILCMLFE